MAVSMEQLTAILRELHLQQQADTKAMLEHITMSQNNALFALQATNDNRDKFASSEVQCYYYERCWHEKAEDSEKRGGGIALSLLLLLRVSAIVLSLSCQRSPYR